MDTSDPLIARIIGEDETVLAVLTARVPMSFPERLVMVGGSEEFASCRIVMTSSRMIVLSVTGAISLISYADLEGTSVSSSARTLSLTYRSGRKETYSHLSPGDAERLSKLLPQLRGNGTSSRRGEREHVCPRCLTRVAGGAAQCWSCLKYFKTRGLAARKALLWPGGGYFYLGFTGPAMRAIAVETLCVLTMFGARWLAIPFLLTSNMIFGGAALALIVWKAFVVMHARRLAYELVIEKIELAPTAGDLARAAGAKAAEAVSMAPSKNIEWVASPPEPLRLPAETVYYLPVATSFCWTDEHGAPSNEVKHDQVRSLERVALLICNVLEPDEAILFITPGSPPFTPADFISPLVVLLLMKRCLFVFTDRRVLQIPLNPSGKPRRSISVLRYGDVTGYSFSGGFTFGSFVNFTIGFVTASGQRVQMARLPLENFHKLIPLVRRVAGSGAPSQCEGRHALCPMCAAEVAPGVAYCVSCRTQFRSRSAAGILALLVSGGGYFYCGYPLMGIAALCYEALLGLSFFLATVGGAIGPATTSAFFLVLQKIAACVHARELTDECVLDHGGVTRYLAEDPEREPSIPTL